MSVLARCVMKAIPGMAAIWAAQGCTGAVRGGPANEVARPRSPTLAESPANLGVLESPSGLGSTGLRRLSREELRQTVLDLSGVDVGVEVNLLPNDPVSTPFDNNELDQVPSAALLEGLRVVAEAATTRLLGDPALRDRAVGCKPAAVDDGICLKDFITRFGRRTLRRSLSTDEISRYMRVAEVATQTKDFYAAVEVLLHTFLQDMEFAYRIEIGTPVSGQNGLRRLSGFEVASRLSYLLWGSTPGDTLLNLAESGGLQTPDGVRNAARGMLEDPRAAARIRRMHAQWLSYESPRFPEPLARAMRMETDGLVDRVTRPGAVWSQLFAATGTVIEPVLAKHYGLPAPDAPGTEVPYGTTGRRGILGHGTFLSNGQKFGKTSVVQRGLFVLRRLLCTSVPDPPPGLAVDVDIEPKGAGPCKADNIRSHTATTACARCHDTIDEIGHGLEGFDLEGRARTRDETGCAVVAKGEVVLGDQPVGKFSGPAELSDLLLSTKRLDGCFIEQAFGYWNGRPVDQETQPAVNALTEGFRKRKHDFRALLLDFVSTPAFQHRVQHRVQL